MNVDMNSITGIPTMDGYYRNLALNPVFIVIIIVVILAYVLLFSSLGGSGANDAASANGGGKILGIVMASIFLILLLINGFNYFLNIDVVTTAKGLFTRHPEIDINVLTPQGAPSTPVPEIQAFEQVYHVPGNEYTYGDAKALCKAYGGRLANIKEMLKAYREGGDWCSYGWSDDQMALFPTQYKHWKMLQKVDGHENDCGRPGLNGGFIDNPSVRFGANCFGHRPKITPTEAEIMELTPTHPITQREQEFDERVSYWKQQLNDILVSPFAPKQWSRTGI
jgi:hypothetical protein